MIQNLSQAQYKDSNGRDIDAGAADYLTTYKFKADGFHNWACGKCGEDHFDRSCGWPIAGQILPCRKCGAMNLLLRSDCAAITLAMTEHFRHEEMKVENERLTGIRELNRQQLLEIRRDLTQRVLAALALAPAGPAFAPVDGSEPVGERKARRFMDAIEALAALEQEMRLENHERAAEWADKTHAFSQALLDAAEQTKG